MKWNFWKRHSRRGDASDTHPKLPKPKELPSHIGMHLVVKEKLDPDWVWALHCVKRPSEDEGIFKFRIFSKNDAREAGVHVVNYDSLDAHGGLILFDGVSDKWGSVFHIESRRDDRAA